MAKNPWLSDTLDDCYERLHTIPRKSYCVAVAVQICHDWITQEIDFSISSTFDYSASWLSFGSHFDLCMSGNIGCTDGCCMAYKLAARAN